MRTGSFDLVGAFISDLHRMRDIEQIPEVMRLGQFAAADDLAYWLNLLSEEIKQRDAAESEIADVMFALHALLNTALRRLRSDRSH